MTGYGDGRCAVQFRDEHAPAHLLGVCTLPEGHEGPHDNVLPKPIYGRTALSAPTHTEDEGVE